MLKKYSWGPRVVGVLLIGSGLFLIFRRSPSILGPLVTFGSLILIQLFQGEREPLLGLVGIACSAIWVLIILLVRIPLPQGSSTLDESTSRLLIALAVMAPLFLGLILVGISMNQVKVFPNKAGTWLAITPLIGIILGFAPVLGIVYFLLGIFSIRSSSIENLTSRNIAD
jgi:hypothetical protein